MSASINDPEALVVHAPGLLPGLSAEPLLLVRKTRKSTKFSAVYHGIRIGSFRGRFTIVSKRWEFEEAF